MGGGADAAELPMAVDAQWFPHVQMSKWQCRQEGERYRWVPCGDEHVDPTRLTQDGDRRMTYPIIYRIFSEWGGFSSCCNCLPAPPGAKGVKVRDERKPG